MKTHSPAFWKRLVTVGALSALAVMPLIGAQTVTNWVAFNDHEGGASPNPNVTTYSLTQSGNVGQPVGGAMKDFATGSALGARLDITSEGYINGTTGSSAAPEAGTPADQIFGGKINFAASALYFGPSPYTASVTLTFTNLTPGAKYNFRGTAVRGNAYVGRWSMATLVGASSSTPAHITGTSTTYPSPGIITNGWSPYGDALIPGLQAAWNSGENRGGDVIAWDNIVPIGNTFSVVCSNWAFVAGGSGAVPNGTMGATYCYALEAVMLEELVEQGPVEITQQPAATTSVEAFLPVTLTIAVSGALPTYQWYKGDLGVGTPIEGANAAAYTVPSAMPGDSGNYYVVVANSINSVTSTLASVTVFVNPIVITTQPTNRITALQNRPFTLSVQNTGTNPQYQWYKDGGPILDATNSTYSVAMAQPEDAGDYYVIVSNITSTETSTTTTVIFSSDDVPPAIVRIVGSGNNDQVTIEFNEAINDFTAMETSSYSFEPYLDVFSAILTNDRTVVLLTGPQTPGQEYTVTVTALDLVLNFLYTTTNYTAWVPNLTPGVIFEVYYTGAGSVISNLTNSAIFPDMPDRALSLTNFSTTNVWLDADNTAAYREGYGGRLRGFFIPPVSGEWRFFTYSDDASEVYINTNGPSADGKQMIAYEPDCCDGFLEPAEGEPATSAPIPLLAGVPYYLEAIYKEGTGGDYCLVAARREGDPTPANQLPAIIANGFPFVPAWDYGVTEFTAQPADVSVESPGAAQLTVAAANSLNIPFSYQWQQSDGMGGFTNIPSAMTKTVSLTTLTEVGSYQFRCIAAAGTSAATSQVATVTVTPDVTGPQVLSASRDATGTNILVTFGEAVLDTTATVPGNYQVCDAFLPGNCVTVLNAVMTNNGMAVLLETAQPDPAGIYRITFTGITDVHGNALRPPTAIPMSVVLSFQQGVNNYAGTVDTHIRSDNATTSYGANAAVLADNLSPLSHALLRFDNLFGTGAGQIPPGATISSARLFLRTDNDGNVVRFHRMLVTWDGSSTWNNLGSANDGVSTNANGDAVNTPEFTYDPVSVGSVAELNVTASVNVWATNGGPNYGWAIINTSDDGYQFNSAEATDITMRPRLVIAYTPVTEVQPVQVVGQPTANQTVNEGANVNLTVGVTGTRPQYQWYKDGALIMDATNSTLQLQAVVETASGQYYCVVSNFAPSQVVSENANLVVLPDTNRPTVVSVLGTTNASEIRVVFSKRMDPASLSEADFVVSPAAGGADLTTLGVSLATNGTTLTVTTSPRNPYGQYKMTIQNVTDAAYRHNPLTPDPTVVFFAAQVSLRAPVSDWRYYEVGDPGAGWQTTGFDDSLWPVGTALFVAKNGTPGNGDIPLVTTNVYGQITYYYRGSFTMPSQAELAAASGYILQVRPILDDGAVFYINGQEARRIGMDPTNTIANTNLATRTQGNDYRFEGPYELPIANVVFGGNNLMAVEVHQQSATSSDIAFAAEVLVTIMPAGELVLKGAAPVGGANILLSWPVIPGVVLYQADRVEGPYTPVAGNPQGSYNVNTAAAAGRFYQVRSQ